MSYSASPEIDVKHVFHEIFDEIADDIKKEIDDEIEESFQHNPPTSFEVEGTGSFADNIRKVFKRKIESKYMKLPYGQKIAFDVKSSTKIYTKYVNKNTLEPELGADLVIIFEVLGLDNKPVISKTILIQAKSVQKEFVKNKYFTIRTTDLKNQINKMSHISSGHSYIAIYSSNGVFLSNAIDYIDFNSTYDFQKSQFITAGDFAKKIGSCEIGDQGYCSPKEMGVERLNDGEIVIEDFYLKLLNKASPNLKNITPDESDSTTIVDISIQAKNID